VQVFPAPVRAARLASGGQRESNHGCPVTSMDMRCEDPSGYRPIQEERGDRSARTLLGVNPQVSVVNPPKHIYEFEGWNYRDQ
jgi:hypothetical protein